jgi:hypothetical protein
MVSREEGKVRKTARQFQRGTDWGATGAQR